MNKGNGVVKSKQHALLIYNISDYWYTTNTPSSSTTTPKARTFKNVNFGVIDDAIVSKVTNSAASLSITTNNNDVDRNETNTTNNDTVNNNNSKLLATYIVLKPNSTKEIELLSLSSLQLTEMN